MATLGSLHDQDATTSPWTVGQRNAEEIERNLFFRIPTRRNSTPVTTMGAPANGTWFEAQVYRDVYRAEFICTAAGTPGTWIQLSPAVVTANPSSPLTGYWILRADLNFNQFFWNGTTWLPIGAGALGSALPLPTGAASAGVSINSSREDHVHALGDISEDYPPELMARLNIVLLR